MRSLIRWLVVILAVGLAVVWSGSGDAVPSSAAPGALALQAPAFVGVAHAEEPTPVVAAQQSAAEQIQNEAGIAAYIKAAAIDLSSSTLRSRFRSIERATDGYIIGSVGVPDYGDNDDAHVYVSVDGWVLAYYLKNEPTAKIFDWRAWDGGASIPTKLDRVLEVVTSGIGSSLPARTYYHFQYPNATHMLLIGDRAFAGSDSFQVTLPGSFLYFERSWSLACSKDEAALWLNGGKVASSGFGQIQGVLEAGQLLPDTMHTLAVSGATHWGGTTGSGVLALIYRVP